MTAERTTALAGPKAPGTAAIDRTLNPAVRADTMAGTTAPPARSAAAIRPETGRLYQVDWTAFEDWCRRRGRVGLPADAATVADFLTEAAANPQRWRPGPPRGRHCRAARDCLKVGGAWYNRPFEPGEGLEPGHSRGRPRARRVVPPPTLRQSREMAPAIAFTGVKRVPCQKNLKCYSPGPSSPKNLQIRRECATLNHLMGDPLPDGRSFVRNGPLLEGHSFSSEAR